MRTKIIAGNWKMNKTVQEGIVLIEEILKSAGKLQHENLQIILAPPFPLLGMASALTSDYRFISISAQNCYYKNNGAFTGEVSPAMIKSTGANHVIIGHSERRMYFHEDNSLLSEKIKVALQNGLTPVYCCGETLSERNEASDYDIIKNQLEETIFSLDEEEIIKIVIAYEPVWAIGTGVNATPEQAQEMHRFIRTQVALKFKDDIAEKIPILYGGSVKPENAYSLFSCTDIDGGLIGGASLNSNDFVAIINS